MKPHALILLLLSLLGADVNAQTPYDAFAPETSRPMFVLDDITTREGSSQCNVINDSIWSTKSSADDISKWLSVDPLSDKYPSVSPYAYCNWNPVKYVDPDGRENVVALPNPADETKQVIRQYESNKPVIHVFAHGEHSRIQLPDNGNGEKGNITSPEQLDQFLLSNSEIWQGKGAPGDDGYALIVLHSCATGQGENPIAQQISASPKFENVLIVAPSDNIRIMSDITENVPARNMFLNGKFVNSFDGKSRPVFSNPKKQVEKYLNKK